MTLVLESPENYIWRSWKVVEKISFRSCLQRLRTVGANNKCLTSLLHAPLFALAVAFVLWGYVTADVYPLHLQILESPLKSPGILEQ